MNSRWWARLGMGIVAVAMAACGGGTVTDPDGSTPGEDGGVDSGRPPPDPDAVAVLDLHALDLWGQDLPDELADLTITAGGAPVATSGWPVISLDLFEATTYELTLTAEDHEPLRATVTFDGTAALTGLAATVDDVGAGLSVRHEQRTVGGRTITFHSVMLGARHRWFSAQGRPARRGNRIRLMTSGEEAWGQVAEDLVTATDTVNLATWWWGSDFELVRDASSHVTSSAADRERNTILSVLDEAAAEKRVLVGQLVSMDGIFMGLTIDAPLRDRAMAAGDRFEHMGQANPSRGTFRFEVTPFLFRDVLARRRPELSGGTFDMESLIESTVPPRDVDLTIWPVTLDVPAASYHQKFITVDGRIAFVGGMNLRPVDWDTDAHLVFEPRRMSFDATTAERMAVVDREALPDNGPRKDYMTRIEGPLVQDVDELFQMRWSYLLDEDAEYSENASDFTVRRDQAPVSGGVQAQITATLPAPFDEHAIAETWFNAVGNAERYIFIEDQYFRVPMLVDLIIERMTMVPGLQLVVITKPVSELTDPGCEWTARTHQELETRFPTRYHLYQLRSFDYVLNTFLFDELEERFTDIDIHSKLLIVDDVFLSVGSANKNNRGIVYEGELNVAIVDRAWVRSARRRVLEGILPPSTAVSDTDWITQLAEAAAWNQSVWESWEAEGGDIDAGDGTPPAAFTPAGLVYPLDFRAPAECLIEGVGPDMT